MNKAARTRLQKFISHLSLRQPSVARRQHQCAICTKPIMLGEQYRDGGEKHKRAHINCYVALADELRRERTR